MKTIPRFIILLVFLGFSINGFSQSKIDKSKTEIKNGNNGAANQTPVPGSSTSHKNRDNQSTEERTLRETITNAISKAVLYVTFYSTIGDYKREDHLENRLTKFPFYNKYSGNYEAADTGKTSKNRFRLDVDYQFLYSSKNLAGHYFNINIRPSQYGYLQAQYRKLLETNLDTASSSLSLFNFNFCYDRLRFERFNVGWKLGACYIGNNINKAGFSFGLDAEAFVFNPISIYVSKQWSEINNVPINSFDAMVKFYRNRYNFQLGYEHLKIGSPLYDYMSLGIGVKF
jgi:hypothetical protein